MPGFARPFHARDQSARGLAQSTTWRSFPLPPNIAKRLGLRVVLYRFSLERGQADARFRPSISRARSKRQRTGAVQDLAEFPAASEHREASWTAGSPLP